MVKTNQAPSLFKKVITKNNDAEELKLQVVINMTEYDTSSSKDFIEGGKVFRGYTTMISTLKPNNNKVKARIDINPADQELRAAINEMYSAYDKIIKKE